MNDIAPFCKGWAGVATGSPPSRQPQATVVLKLTNPSSATTSAFIG
ncbi:MAG: hypothetical protein KDB40_02400 [Acidimicrobiales bacterium]|nr:hypothetical protein [Acidimicrobiales bacterium]